MTTTLQTTWTTDTPLQEKIIEVVADCCMVKVYEIKAPERGDREISDARHIAAYFLYHNCKMTLRQVGPVLDGRHYSTIIKSLKVVEDMRDSNKDFRRKFDCSKAVIDNILEDERSS